MSQNPRIAILGAGNVGGNLGILLTRHGIDVRFGVREGSDVKDVLAKTEGRAEAVSVPAAAAWGDILFLTVPANAAVDALKAAGDLSGRVVVDCTNPVKWADGPVLDAPPEGSVTAALARAFPTARVVKGFSTFGAEFHIDPKLGGSSIDVQLAGDDAGAKMMVASLASRAGFTPVDAGPLRNAALLESLAVLWIHLATKGGHGRQVGFKLLKRE